MNIEEYIEKQLRESNDNIFEGDMWLGIEHPNYKFGLFCQVEQSEENENDYNVIVYKNINGENQTDYSKTITKFKIQKKKV